MATRSALVKKAPAKQATAKQPAAVAKAASSTPVVSLKAVFADLKAAV